MICHNRFDYGSDEYLCASCLESMPVTQFWMYESNPMTEKIKSICPQIEHISSVIFYRPGSRWSRLIHDMKYRDHSSYCSVLGKILGEKLLESPYYNEVDMVIGVPLHPWRQMMRGYNQSNNMAQSVAQVLGVEYRNDVVRRLRNNKQQARSNRKERWQNVQQLFEVVNAEVIEGRNILIVDDVITSSATMLSCTDAILSATANCRLWHASFAASNKEYGNWG